MNNPVDKTSVLIVTTVGCFLMPFISSALTVALPQIGIELSLEVISLTWIMSAFLLTSTVLILPFGRIADIYGRKRIYTYGMIAVAVTSLLMPLVNSGLMLLILQFVQGAGSALVFCTGVAILTSAFPVGERGRAMGLNVTAVYLGLSTGPFLGGLLTQHLGWRSIFILSVVLALIVITLIFVRLRGDWVEAKGEKFDTSGAVIYCVVLAAVLYGFMHLSDWYGAWFIAAGILGLWTFTRWEKKRQSPMVDMKLFSNNRAFIFSCLATLINYGAVSAVSFLISLYLQYLKGFNPQDAGFVLVALPIVQALLSTVAGRLSDRAQPHTVASAGMAICAAGLLFFVFLNEETSLAFIIAGLVTVGLGLAFFISPNINAVMSSVEKKYYGIASGTVATMRYLGMIVNMGIVMLLFTLYVGRVQITPEYYGAFLQSLKVAFIISVILCCLGIAASLVKGKTDKVGHQ